MSGGKLQTKAVATFLKDIDIDALPFPSAEINEAHVEKIEAYASWEYLTEARTKYKGQKMFLDALDVRQNVDTMWTRMHLPFI
jgi:hypothetical protein